MKGGKSGIDSSIYELPRSSEYTTMSAHML